MRHVGMMVSRHNPPPSIGAVLRQRLERRPYADRPKVATAQLINVLPAPSPRETHHTTALKTQFFRFLLRYPARSLSKRDDSNALLTLQPNHYSNRCGIDQQLKPQSLSPAPHLGYQTCTGLQSAPSERIFAADASVQPNNVGELASDNYSACNGNSDIHARLPRDSAELNRSAFFLRGSHFTSFMDGGLDDLVYGPARQALVKSGTAGVAREQDSRASTAGEVIFIPVSEFRKQDVFSDSPVVVISRHRSQSFDVHESSMTLDTYYVPFLPVHRNKQTQQRTATSNRCSEAKVTHV